MLHIGVSAPQWLLDFIVVHIHPQKPFKNLDLLEEFMFVKCNLHITASFCISISSNVFLLLGPKVGVRAEITKIKTRSCFQGGSWTWQLRNHLGHPHIQYYNAWVGRLARFLFQFLADVHRGRQQEIPRALGSVRRTWETWAGAQVPGLGPAQPQLLRALGEVNQQMGALFACVCLHFK